MSHPSRPFFSFLFSLFTAALCAAPASASAAAFSPLQIGIGSPDWQLVSEDTPVIGLRLNLPGSFNDTVAGLDLGLLSDDTATFSGLRLNAISYSHACNGIAIALFDMAAFLNGVQIAPLAIAGNACGLQIGIVLLETENFTLNSRVAPTRCLYIIRPTGQMLISNQ